MENEISGFPKGNKGFQVSVVLEDSWFAEYGPGVDLSMESKI